jgi:hypothetical protein
MNDNGPKPLRRREFLALGSAGLSALFLSGGTPALAAELLAPGARPDGSGPISLAYWQGSDALPDLDWPTAVEGLDPETLPPLIPAGRLRSGDPMLEATGVRLTLHGLFPPPQDLESLQARASVLLDLVYEPVKPVVHRAWNLRGGQYPNVSSRVSLFVPVEEESRSVLLRGELRGFGVRPRRPLASGRQGQAAPRGVQPPKAEAPRLLRRAFSTRLTVGTERGVPKLRRGFYLIGLPAKVDGQPPDWNADPTQIASGEFSCILISVEYGDLPK